MLPSGAGAPIVRTDFTNQHAWDELCELVREFAAEGLLTDLRLVDDLGYGGATAGELLAMLPEDAGYAYLAVVDLLTLATAARPQDRTLLFVDVDDEEGSGATFRAMVSELASIDANLSIANQDFSDYADDSVDDDVASQA